MVIIPHPSHQAPGPVLYADLVSRLKEALVTAFDMNISVMTNEVVRLEEKRAVVGWNFWLYCRAKEDLASALEAMCLLEDALAQYDELESQFFRSLHGESP